MEPKITGEVRWEWVAKFQGLVRSLIPPEAMTSKDAALVHVASTADTMLFCVADYMREQGFTEAAPRRGAPVREERPWDRG